MAELIVYDDVLKIMILHISFLIAVNVQAK